MDKKDKEAFEKWFAQNPVNKFETEEAWQASCKYKQKQIDELKSTLIYIYDWYGMFMGDVAKDKIKKAVEGEKMNKLQKEIEKELSLTNPDVSKLEDFIYLLQEKLNKAEEVIRFYASNESWLCSMDSSIGDSITAFDYEENSSITKRRFVGGKRAREFLKKLEGEK